MKTQRSDFPKVTQNVRQHQIEAQVHLTPKPWAFHHPTLTIRTTGSLSITPNLSPNAHSHLSGLQLTPSPSKPLGSHRLEQPQPSSSLIGSIHPACEEGKGRGRTRKEGAGRKEEDEEGGALEWPPEQQDWSRAGGAGVRLGPQGRVRQPLLQAGYRRHISAQLLVKSAGGVDSNDTVYA